VQDDNGNCDDPVSLPDQPEDIQFVDGADGDGIAYVFFDIETNGFGKSAQIVQIAAVHNNDTFSRYIIPSRGR